MNRITKLRLALARLLIPADMLPTREEADLIKSIMDREVLESGLMESGDGFHQQAAAIQVQIDLETWGLIPGSALRSIGAAVTMPYDVHGLSSESFKVNITQESCLAVGLTVDPGTVEWWDRQSQEAKDMATEDAVALSTALMQFNWWLTGLVEKAANSEYTVEFALKLGAAPILTPCGNGATMDISLLEAAYRAVNMGYPWEFWAAKDTRTVVAMGRAVGLIDRRIKRLGVAHEAAADARYDGARTAAVQRAVIALAKPGIALLD